VSVNVSDCDLDDAILNRTNQLHSLVELETFKMNGIRGVSELGINFLMRDGSKLKYLKFRNFSRLKTHLMGWRRLVNEKNWRLIINYY
jgi:hypothetical protein